MCPCGVVTSGGRRCVACSRNGRGFVVSDRRDDPHRDPAWRNRSRRVLAEWRAQHGQWCPGWRRDGHVSSDLTVDHVVALMHGGSLLSGEVQVLCRSCNSAKGRTEQNEARARARREADPGYPPSSGDGRRSRPPALGSPTGLGSP